MEPSNIQVNMSEEEVSAKVLVTMESLTEEQRQQVEQSVANFQKCCLQSFVITQQGPVQKILLPMTQPGGQIGEQLQQQQDQCQLGGQSHQNLFEQYRQGEQQYYQLGGQAYQYHYEQPNQQYRPEESYQQYQPEKHQRHYYEEEQQQQQNINWAVKIAEFLEERFGLKPKEQTFTYRQPYPEWFDCVPLPRRYKVPDFSKFSGQGDVSTIEHISRFLAQCGEASATEALKVRLFPLSLTGSAFTWFSSLPQNSIRSWADLEKQFHQYFFAGNNEMKLSDLILVEQQEGESAMEYIQRFRNIRSRCYSLSLSDEQLASLAFQGLSAPIKERFFSQDFDSLAHLMQTISVYESRLRNTEEDQFWRSEDQKEDNFEA